MRVTFYLILLTQLVPFCAFAARSGDPSAICDQVAERAAAESGVPLAVLQAIQLTETARERDGRMRPWAWTINMEGKGLWFDSRAAALAYVQREFQRGARSFDLGCFQVNYKWHHSAFRSLEEMMEPMANARYAARLLRDLFAETRNWPDAAGAYHSRTPHLAQRYAARFRQFLGLLQPSALPTLQEQRVNSFPLLIGGQSHGMGSLVPMGEAGGVALLGRE